VARQQDSDDEVHKITNVSEARSDKLAGKERRYMISMAIRTVCFILLVVVPGPAKWAFLIGAVFLPYVAVVFANDPGRAKGPSPFGEEIQPELQPPQDQP
jgi:hypothetical protein